MKAIIIAALLLAGCSTMSETPPPADWPHMRVVEHTGLGFWETQKKCYKYLSLPMKLLGSFAMGCAEFYFATGECHVYYMGEPSKLVRDHEREHCQGFDHSGSTDVAQSWERYQAAH